MLRAKSTTSGFLQRRCWFPCSGGTFIPLPLEALSRVASPRLRINTGLSRKDVSRRFWILLTPPFPGGERSETRRAGPAVEIWTEHRGLAKYIHTGQNLTFWHISTCFYPKWLNLLVVSPFGKILVLLRTLSGEVLAVRGQSWNGTGDCWAFFINNC